MEDGMNETATKNIFDDEGVDFESRLDEQEEEEFDDEEAVEAAVDLIESDYTSNEDQGAFVQILQGFAFSELPFATESIARIQDGEDLKETFLLAAEESDLDEEMVEMIEDAEPGGQV